MLLIVLVFALCSSTLPMSASQSHLSQADKELVSDNKNAYYPIVETVGTSAKLLWDLIYSVVFLMLFYYSVILLSSVLGISRWFCLVLLLLAISFKREIYECNETLKATALAKSYLADPSSSPCDKTINKWWFQDAYQYLKNRVTGKDPLIECRDYILETEGVKSCDPTKVLTKVIVKMPQNFIHYFTKGIFEIFKEGIESAGFVGKIIIPLLVLLVLFVLISNVIRISVQGFNNFLERPTRYFTTA